MSTDKHGNSRTPYLYIFQAAKNYPADFSAIFVVFILPEVNMIGSRVTVDAPRGVWQNVWAQQQAFPFLKGNGKDCYAG